MAVVAPGIPNQRSQAQAPDNKSIHQLNPKCIGDLFQQKRTKYSMRNPVKVLQPMKRTTTYGLRTISYTGAKLWNDLSPFLNNDADFDVFKSLLTVLTSDRLDPNFTYV